MCGVDGIDRNLNSPTSHFDSFISLWTYFIQENSSTEVVEKAVISSRPMVMFSFPSNTEEGVAFVTGSNLVKFSFDGVLFI